MRRREQGSTLILAVAVLGLLMLLASLLTAIPRQEAWQLDRHYEHVRAEYLSLAGLARARAWAGAGLVTNATYTLGPGSVSVQMTRGAGKTCQVESLGRIEREPLKKPLIVRTEGTVLLP